MRCVDAWTIATTSSGPSLEPDLVHAALEKVGGRPEDAHPDRRHRSGMWKQRTAPGVEALAVLTGGFSEQELIGGGRARSHLGRRAAPEPGRAPLPELGGVSRLQTAGRGLHRSSSSSASTSS